MDEINHLLTLINPAYFEGAGAVVIILLIYKFIKKNKKPSNKKTKQKSKVSEKKQASNKQEDFDPQTYTVETQEDMDDEHIPQPPVIRRKILLPGEPVIETANIVSPKKSTQNPLYLLDLAKSLDAKNDKIGAINSLQAAIRIQEDSIEKLIYERILLRYSQHNDRSLKELLNHKDSFLNDESDFLPIVELPNFDDVKLKKKVNPQQVTISIIPQKAPNTDDFNTDNLDSFTNDNTLDKFEFKSDRFNLHEENDTIEFYNSPALLAKAIEENNFDNHIYELEELRMNNNDNTQNLTYNVWVHWMTVANGKTSFKSNTLKLKNPWTGKKAILEITEILNSTSKNSDGTNAPWAILSVTPFYEDL